MFEVLNNTIFEANLEINPEMIYSVYQEFKRQLKNAYKIVKNFYL